MLLLIALLLLSLALIATGLVMWCVPVAFIATGALLGAVVLFVDFENLKGGRR